MKVGRDKTEIFKKYVKKSLIIIYNINISIKMKRAILRTLRKD